MVVCKYYQHGNCRYGQYCQFEHINNFGNNKIDSYENELVMAVAKEASFAERGGQWLLSCFAPLKDRPCIPGMNDVSPEEVRWEIYQAQKNGMVEQAKSHFQQLCQNMKAKRVLLKNPTEEVASILKNVLGSGQKSNTSGKSSIYTWVNPQLSLPNNTSTSNLFGNKTFGIQNNPFGGGFTSPTNTSMFGRSNNNTSVFGGTATFQNNLGFGTASNTNSIFGTKPPTSFNSIQNTQTFANVNPQDNPVFGGSSQGVLNQTSVFGGSPQDTLNQTNVFGGTNQLGNAFTNDTTPNSLFNGPMTSQTSNSIFGGTKTTTANFFEGTSGLQANSAFNPATSSTSFSSGILSQSKLNQALPTFGGAPVFGAATNYANSSNSMFNSQTFPASTISTSNVFGGSATTTTSAFSLTQQPTNIFGAAVSTSTPNVFNTQNNVMSVGNTTPFGGTPATNNPFATATSQFESTSTSSTPFASRGFGLPITTTSNTFGNTATSSNSPFANTGSIFSASPNTTVSNLSPFSTPTFGNLNASPFGSTSTTVTNTSTSQHITSAINPFAPREKQNNVPFGNINQYNMNANNNQFPFGNSPFNIIKISSIIDDTVYTAEGLLTDDEKSMFLAEKFIFGKIPLKPPTKEIR